MGSIKTDPTNLSKIFFYLKKIAPVSTLSEVLKINKAEFNPHSYKKYSG
jgi:hypothetical protein